MKKNGTLINSIKGIKVKIEVVNGTGRGEGKEYINLIFSDKPSETVREAMKKHHFKFFSVNGNWSAYKSDKAMEFAYSLIKENNIKTDIPKETETTKPTKTARGSANKKTTKAPTTEERLKALESDMADIKAMLKEALAK